MAAAAVGDESALGELYDRHAGAMLGVALRMLKVRQDAEDLVHDVFVEAWQKAADFDAAAAACGAGFVRGAAAGGSPRSGSAARRRDCSATEPRPSAEAPVSGFEGPTASAPGAGRLPSAAS
jgi:RNA polymerase sigma-70 factor (ECF subfamily)